MFEWHDNEGAGWSRDGPGDDAGPGDAERCRFPGCGRAARETLRRADRHNGLPPLCRRHQWMLRYGGWRVTRDPDGTHTWTSPAGRRYHGR
ncbi:MAG: hypothetical protein GEV10_01860 [Streptosporangiales bacterium]|nr:hypothetical protein [Streptosporangiales bacterium]